MYGYMHDYDVGEDKYEDDDALVDDDRNYWKLKSILNVRRVCACYLGYCICVYVNNNGCTTTGE